MYMFGMRFHVVCKCKVGPILNMNMNFDLCIFKSALYIFVLIFWISYDVDFCIKVMFISEGSL